MSDSDTSDATDTRLEQIRQAVDLELLDDAMFKESGSAKGKQEEKVAHVISQRTIVEESSGAGLSDIIVPENVQKYIAQKLSELIESRFEFVDKKNRKATPVEHRETSEADGGVWLTRDAGAYISQLDEASGSVKQKRFSVKRRQVEEDGLSNADKCRLASVPFDCITSHPEFDHSTPRSKAAKSLYRYKKTKTGLHFIEPATEFSSAKNTNNWTEKNISRKSKWRLTNSKTLML